MLTVCPAKKLIAKDYSQETICLAQNIFYEARDEQTIGQVAVGFVVLNRTKDGKFPGTICGVIHEKHKIRNHYVCQFSWVCNRQRVKWNDQDKKDWLKAINLAKVIIENNITDPTRGSIFFHDRKIHPSWIKEMKFSNTIGSHKFYQRKIPFVQIAENPD